MGVWPFGLSSEEAGTSSMRSENKSKAEAVRYRHLDHRTTTLGCEKCSRFDQAPPFLHKKGILRNKKKKNDNKTHLLATAAVQIVHASEYCTVASNEWARRLFAQTKARPVTHVLAQPHLEARTVSLSQHIARLHSLVCPVAARALAIERWIAERPLFESTAQTSSAGHTLAGLAN